jgi:hypothetical protein
MAFPTDPLLITLISDHLPKKDLLSLALTNSDVYESLDQRLLEREKLNLLDYTETLKLLNNLGRYYHTGDGFEFKDRIHKKYTCRTCIPSGSTPKWFSDNLDSVFSMYDSKIYWYDDLDEDILDFEELYVLNPIRNITKMSQKKTVFEEVVIKHLVNDWYGTLPGNWYDKHKNRWAGGINSMKLPPVKSKPYITVVEHLMEVKISAVTKRSPITINDILFATRVLAIDSTRECNEYTVLEVDGNTLTLTPEIDNSST